MNNDIIEIPHPSNLQEWPLVSEAVKDGRVKEGGFVFMVHASCVGDFGGGEMFLGRVKTDGNNANYRCCPRVRIAAPPKPKVRPEDQPGVRYKLADVELTHVLTSGMYLYGQRSTGSTEWVFHDWRAFSDTHVVFIAAPEVPRD